MKALIFFADGVDGVVFRKQVFGPNGRQKYPTLYEKCKVNSLHIAEIAITDISFMTMYTGLTAREHGVNFYGSGGKRNEKMKNYALPDLQEELNVPYLWEYFMEAGYTVGLWCLPLTSPAFKVYKWMVSGVPYTTYNKQKLVYPPDIVKFIDNYDLLTESSLKKIVNNFDLFPKSFNRDMVTCSHIVNENNVDVLFYYQYEYDNFSHKNRGRRNNQFLSQYFSALEKQVAEIYKLFEFESFLLVSDHGFAKHRGAKHNGKPIIGPHFYEGIFSYDGPLIETLPNEIKNIDFINTLLEIFEIAKTPEEGVENQFK